MAAEQELLEHVDLQHAEAAAEVDLLLGGDALVAEHHHVVVQVRAVDARKIASVDRTAQVQADDLGAHGTGKRTNLEGLGLGAVGVRQGARGR